MKIAFSMPGRHGDILWAMPTVRALAETYDQPIDLILSPKYSSLADLLRLQPYVRSVSVDPAWEVREEAPMQPRIPPTPIEADLVVHGAYDGWPREPLPFETWRIVRGQVGSSLRSVELTRPWITINGAYPPTELAVGFTDEWYELKLGVAVALEQALPDAPPRLYLTPPNSRWHRETPPGCVSLQPCDWLTAAGIIRNSDCFLGCCSALHVLAIGLGKPCVIMEPNEMRWQDCFWPLGMDGPQVTCVKGGDGKPTHDSRHCAETLRRVLDQVRTVRTGGTHGSPA